MKKTATITLLFILTALIGVVPSFAVTAATSSAKTPTPVNAGLLDQINNLKEKIASKVAAMHLVEKRGMIGTVVSVTDSQITINDLSDNTRFIDVDEITKFSDASGNNIGISDLKKGTYISTLGLYNKDSRHLLARFVNVLTLPTYMTGEIISTNRVAGTFYVQDENNKQRNIDVESFTKTQSFSKDTALTKIGFSKLTPGNRVIIVGYPDKKDATLLIASRIIWVIDAVNNPKITANTTTASGSATTAPSK